MEVALKIDDIPVVAFVASGGIDSKQFVQQLIQSYFGARPRGKGTSVPPVHIAISYSNQPSAAQSQHQSNHGSEFG